MTFLLSSKPLEIIAKQGVKEEQDVKLAEPQEPKGNLLAKR
jgi:hypothetical protein